MFCEKKCTNENVVGFREDAAVKKHVGFARFLQVHHRKQQTEEEHS